MARQTWLPNWIQPTDVDVRNSNNFYIDTFLIYIYIYIYIIYIMVEIKKYNCPVLMQ